MTARARQLGSKNLVGFEVGGVRYAVGIEHVREILRPFATLPLPHVPRSVVGVIDHRGDVVPIIDLRMRFNAPREDGREVRWVIVTRGSSFTGLVVDRVTEVFGISERSEREVPAIEAGQDERGIVAACSHRGRLVFVLDVDKLTSVADDLELRTQHPALEEGA